jgi:hypothetical protein
MKTTQSENKKKSIGLLKGLCPQWACYSLQA